MKWFEINIATTSEGTEIMSELLFEAGAKGVVIEDREELIRFINDGEGFDYTEADLIRSYDSAVKVKGYLPDDSGTNDLIAEDILSLMSDNGINFVETHMLGDWVAITGQYA